MAEALKTRLESTVVHVESERELGSIFAFDQGVDLVGVRLERSPVKKDGSFVESGGNTDDTMQKILSKGSVNSSIKHAKGNRDDSQDSTYTRLQRIFTPETEINESLPGGSTLVERDRGSTTHVVDSSGCSDSSRAKDNPRTLSELEVKNSSVIATQLG